MARGLIFVVQKDVSRYGGVNSFFIAECFWSMNVDDHFRFNGLKLTALQIRIVQEVVSCDLTRK